MDKEYDFLKQFDKRMRFVGRFAVILSNIVRKSFYKDYGFENDESINVTFAVLLFIMEKSLREEMCTIDDIATFIDKMNIDIWHREKLIGGQRDFADKIINDVLTNNGAQMTFTCDSYDTDKSVERVIRIIGNKPDYDENKVRRTSYYLTEDGYSMLFSTLEVESSMRFTIDEMIFKIQMDKKDYEKAAESIKGVFSDIRAQAQKIKDNMMRIRQDALSYSIDDYKEILSGDMETLKKSQKEFEAYRENVSKRKEELKSIGINERDLDEKEINNLMSLETIEDYLMRSLTEQQKIIGLHFDLKNLYDRELEALSELRYIKRFSLRNEVYDKVIKNPEALSDIGIFMRPLFTRKPDKIYNPALAGILQRPIRKTEEKDNDTVLENGDGITYEERREMMRRRLMGCRRCLESILDIAFESAGRISFEEINDRAKSDSDIFNKIYSDVSVFKQVMVELINTGTYDIELMRKERKDEIIDTDDLAFHAGSEVLDLCDTKYLGIKKITIMKIPDEEKITIENVPDSDGNLHSVTCSDLNIRME